MSPRLAGKCLSVTTPLRRLKPYKYTPFTSCWPQFSPSPRALTTESSDRYEQRPGDLTYPRWQATPPRMTAPVRSKPPVLNNAYKVNESQSRLDDVFENVLGKNGHLMLPEEVMWLAVTHKSFDHARRGYNDRLAFFGLIQTLHEPIGTGADTKVSTGRRIVNLQKSLAVLSHSSTMPNRPLHDVYGRVPFQHPALDGVGNLLGVPNGDSEQKDDPRFLGGKEQIAQLADRYGLLSVIRWKPKNVFADLS